jgi:hypothetical protein
VLPGGRLRRIIHAELFLLPFLIEVVCKTSHQSYPCVHNVKYRGTCDDLTKVCLEYTTMLKRKPHSVLGSRHHCPSARDDQQSVMNGNHNEGNWRHKSATRFFRLSDICLWSITQRSCLLRAEKESTERALCLWHSPVVAIKASSNVFNSTTCCQRVLTQQCAV